MRKPSRQGQGEVCLLHRVSLLSVPIRYQSPDDMPVSLFVSLCKRGLRLDLQARAIEILRTKVKRGLNIPQPTPVRELCKAPDKELIPAIELDGMPVTTVAIDTLAEFVFGKKRHELCEDCFAFVYSLQERAFGQLYKLTSSNRKKILSL